MRQLPSVLPAAGLSPAYPGRLVFKSPCFWARSWLVSGELWQGTPAVLLTYGMLQRKS